MLYLTSSMTLSVDLGHYMIYHAKYSEPLFIMTFVITAKFVITSIRSAQKSANHVFFHGQSHVVLLENIRFG